MEEALGDPDREGDSEAHLEPRGDLDREGEEDTLRVTPFAVPLGLAPLALGDPLGVDCRPIGEPLAERLCRVKVALGVGAREGVEATEPVMEAYGGVGEGEGEEVPTTTGVGVTEGVGVEAVSKLALPFPEVLIIALGVRLLDTEALGVRVVSLEVGVGKRGV